MIELVVAMLAARPLPVAIGALFGIGRLWWRLIWGGPRLTG